MDNFKIISQALSQNNADMNNLTIKINKIDTSKEDSFIVLNTDALAGLELPEEITAPEISTDVLLDLFGFNNVSALYSAIPNFDNKIFVLKATLETFKVGSTSYMITNCAPCIGKMIPYAGNNILMLTFLFNTANDYVRIMTLYVDGESSTSVKGRISIKELSSGSSGDIPSLDEYITETELNGKGYATSSYVNGELAKKSDTGHTHSEYLTALPDNVVTYTTDETYGKSISTDTLHASRGILVVDENATDLSMDVIDWGTAIIKGIGIASEQVTSPKVGFTFNEFFGLEEGSTRPKFYWGENDYSRSDTVAFTSDIPSTEGLATETYVNGELAKKSDTGHTHSQYLTEHQDISGKQDVISDLATIRSGAAKGATALQSVPSEYVTETELNGKGYATTSYVNGELAKKSDTGHTHSQYLTEHQDISGKQDVISDLDTIRSGAAKGATALQSVPAEYVTETELNGKGYATTANVNAEIDTINQTMGGLATRLTNVENLTSHDMRASVLWLGTSIPAGDINIDPQQNNTYPKMVADALGFDLYNMAKAGSFVAWYPQAPAWTTSAQVAAEFATGYSLSATRQEIYNKYYNVLETIRRNEGLSTTWRDNYLNDFMDSSFETRIIPYIDGTIASCDGVVIDHGFNDRGNIFAVCQQHVTEDKDSISVWGPGSGADGVEYPVIGGNAGWWWLTHLADNRYYDGEVYMNTVYAVANGLAGNDTGGMRGEYFGAMAYIIAKIQQIDPRIRIVIGNYFSQDYGTALGDNMNSFQTKYILQANQSIADYYGFPCVNVYKHTGLRNRTIRKPDGTTISDMFWFCPDGVHPSSDTTGLSNTIIASAYVVQIKGCFFKLG